MSMSTYIIGFRPPNERWQKMKAIWDACEAANIAAPPEVEEFFGWEPPDPAGVEVELPTHEWQEDTREGFELDTKNIPEGVMTIRFYNSW